MKVVLFCGGLGLRLRDLRAVDLEQRIAALDEISGRNQTYLDAARQRRADLRFRQLVFRDAGAIVADLDADMLRVTRSVDLRAARIRGQPPGADGDVTER